MYGIVRSRDTFCSNAILIQHVFFFFFFYESGHPRDLPSSPTRPSPDPRRPAPPHESLVTAVRIEPFDREPHIVGLALIEQVGPGPVDTRPAEHPDEVIEARDSARLEIGRAHV